MPPTWSSAVVVLAVAEVLAGFSGVASATPPADPPISVVAADPGGRSGAPSIGVGVRDAGGPSGPGTRAAAQSAGTGNGKSVCQWVLAPDVEQWIRRLPTQIASNVGPGRIGRAGGGGRDAVDPTSRLYQRVCDGLTGGYRWFGAYQPGASALPTPAELAQQAYAQLRLPVPTPEHSPDLRLVDGRPAVLVGEQTWLWTDRSRFQSRSRRLQVGPVWAQVTATPVELSFDPGDGSPVVSCAGPGTPFVAGRDQQHAASPTCGYLYEQSSAQQPGGVVPVKYGITWRVSWTGASGAVPAGGQLPEMTSRTATVFAVAEGQALGAEQVRR